MTEHLSEGEKDLIYPITVLIRTAVITQKALVLCIWTISFIVAEADTEITCKDINHL